MSGPEVVTIGELLWDMLPGGPRLGGAHGNLALACARLGRTAVLVSAVGDDPLGREATATLRAEGAGTRFSDALVQTTAEAPTGTVSVTLDVAGQPRYGISAPAAWDFIEATSQALAAVSSAAAVCFGTLAQREPPSQQAIRTLIAAAPAGCTRVFDVNVRLPFCTPEIVRWSFAHADLVKISEEELALVLRMIDAEEAPPRAAHASAPTEAHDVEPHAWQTGELETAARAILRFAPQCQLVAVTLGGRGCLLVTANQTDRHIGFRIRVEDTVGAGDAFTAGMIHAFLTGGSLRAINEVGNRCGSFVASQPGAMPAYPAALLVAIADVLRAG